MEAATTILPDIGTEILIPVCAVIGIGFALIQWVLVAKVKVNGKSSSVGGGVDGKNGYAESLIEEEEGINDHSVVHRCAEIQNAISEGATSFLFTEYQYVGVFM
ncbi:pyrophosphate-energized vacuolar membrane proton pump-like, partial [Capsicum annuum]